MEAATKQIEERKKQLSITSSVSATPVRKFHFPCKHTNLFIFFFTKVYAFNLTLFLFSPWLAVAHPHTTVTNGEPFSLTASWFHCWSCRGCIIYWPLPGCQLHEWCYRKGPQGCRASGPYPIPVSHETWYPRSLGEHGLTQPCCIS